jgi:DNA-binding NarL/FixJ family response regulator
MGHPPRVIIADDQALVRTGFRMIPVADGIEVTAEAADGAEAVEAVRRTRPDVVLMGIRMPRMDGIEVTRRILADDAAGGIRVLILTTYDLDHYVYTALAAGASGFLLKDVTPEHLVAAVTLVRTGDALLAPTITRRPVERFARRDDGGPAGPHRDLPELTVRQLEALIGPPWTRPRSSSSRTATNYWLLKTRPLRAPPARPSEPIGIVK